MRESTIETYFRESVKKLHGMCIKIIPVSMRGLPDRLVLLPGGKILFVELKAPGKKPRPEQLRVHKLLRELGFAVAVIDSKTAVKEVLHEICAAPLSGNGDPEDPQHPEMRTVSGHGAWKDSDHADSSGGSDL